MDTVTKAKKIVALYSDGACSFNPGPGGWAAILFYGDHRKDLSGFVPETTNNRMELFAVIQGLRALKQSCVVEIYSDSAYLVNSFKEGWIERWQRNNWRTSDRSPVSNQDLWKQLLILMSKHDVHLYKVMGHSDDELNNQCDRMARKQVDDYLKLITEKQRAEKMGKFAPEGVEDSSI